MRQILGCSWAERSKAEPARYPGSWALPSPWLRDQKPASAVAGGTRHSMRCWVAEPPEDLLPPTVTLVFTDGPPRLASITLGRKGRAAQTQHAAPYAATACRAWPSCLLVIRSWGGALKAARLAPRTRPRVTGNSWVRAPRPLHHNSFARVIVLVFGGHYLGRRHTVFHPTREGGDHIMFCVMLGRRHVKCTADSTGAHAAAAMLHAWRHEQAIK